MSFDKFLLAVESRDLSQADKSNIRVSSFLFFFFLTEEIQYHDGLRSRELGQAPILLCGPNS